MRLISFTHNGSTRTGAAVDGGVVDLPAADASIPADMVSLLQGGDAMLDKVAAVAAGGGATLSLDKVKLEAPVMRPSKILAVGLNYQAHFDEIPDEVKQRANLKLKDTPVIFNKQTTAVNGPHDPVMLPPESTHLDYEAELGVVIGKTCRRVGEDRAFDVIAGYLALNDVSVRDWQRAAPTMTMGKSWDTHCPMGPALVTRDELPDPESLDVTCTVDGEVKQSFNTRDMLIGIAGQIAYLSTAFTLLPGDVIATGTSAGVALYRPGQPFLKEGQVVRVEVESIGAIENKVVADPGESYIR